MATCTFTPETSRAYEEPQNPVIVSGLDRFFELKGLAQRKQQEQQDREVRAFRPELCTTRCGSTTIPEPFDLSGSGARDGTCQARQGQDLAQIPAEYSFTPQTNESANQEILKQLMSSSLV